MSPHVCHFVHDAARGGDVFFFGAVRQKKIAARAFPCVYGDTAERAK